MIQFTFDEIPIILMKSRIVAVGVGDSGNNIINYMIDEKPSGIELITTTGAKKIGMLVANNV